MVPTSPVTPSPPCQAWETGHPQAGHVPLPGGWGWQDAAQGLERRRDTQTLNVTGPRGATAPSAGASACSADLASTTAARLPETWPQRADGARRSGSTPWTPLCPGGRISRLLWPQGTVRSREATPHPAFPASKLRLLAHGLLCLGLARLMASRFLSDLDRGRKRVESVTDRRPRGAVLSCRGPAPPPRGPLALRTRPAPPPRGRRGRRPCGGGRGVRAAGAAPPCLRRAVPPAQTGPASP